MILNKYLQTQIPNHGLKLNEQKTTLLVIGRGRDTLLSDINFNIILNQHILKPQEYGKKFRTFNRQQFKVPRTGQQNNSKFIYQIKTFI
jgi:hypothetical protein